MKTKNIGAILIALIISFVFAKGDLPLPPAEFPMGSPEIVTNYCVSKVTFIDVVFYRIHEDNKRTILDIRYENRVFSSKEEFDNLAKSWAQEMVGQYVSTNGNLTGRFQINVAGTSAREPFATMIGVIYPFTFPPQQEDGEEIPSLLLPAFDGMNSKLLGYTPYHAPGVSRAILQIKTEDGTMGVVDSKTTSDQSIVLIQGMLKIDSSYLTNPEFTNNLVTISSSPKAYKVYDQYGRRRAEKQPTMSLGRAGSNLTLLITNCEAGRVYKIYSSTNMSDWSGTTLAFEGPYEYAGAKTNLNVIATSPGKFFRVVASDSWLP